MARATAEKTAKKSPARKKATAARKKATGGRKKTSPARKKTGSKASGRKYSPEASEDVAEEMREFDRGTLRSGGSGKKVTNRKQAIAIGLSKARRSGAKVPPKPGARKKRK